MLKVHLGRGISAVARAEDGSVAMANGWSTPLPENLENRCESETGRPPPIQAMMSGVS
jgi:hypothetical protein